LIKTASFAANRYWLLVMDDYTNFIWSFFVKNKNDGADTMITFLLQLQKETKLKFIRWDNSGENNQFQTDDNVHPHMHFMFEYTAPGMISKIFEMITKQIRQQTQKERQTKG
jgi:transposase InsO family protein